MRLRWTTFPGVVIATIVLTAASAFAATVMVDSDGMASPNNCAGTQTVPQTIQGGVDAAQAGDTVKVCGEAAPYAGANVNKSVSLVGIGNPVVNSSGGTGLSLQADKVGVRGFEITGNATGIATSATNSGYKITNNNIHGNTNGIQLDSNGALATVVSGNTISNNTNAGINSTTLNKATIRNNTFANNAVFGLILSPSGTDTGVAVLANHFSGGGHSDIVFNGTVSNSRIVGNTISDPGVASASAAAIYVAGASTGDKVANNSVTTANNYGIWIQSTAPGGVTTKGNKVTNSVNTGIFYDTGTHGNTIARNHSTGSGGGLGNCHDASTGTGTANTANFWNANTAAPSTPAGICT
jgi:Right handed beta helix region